MCMCKEETYEHTASHCPSPSHVLESWEVNNKDENQLLQKTAAIP